MPQPRVWIRSTGLYSVQPRAQLRPREGRHQGDGDERRKGQAPDRQLLCHGPILAKGLSSGSRRSADSAVRRPVSRAAKSGLPSLRRPEAHLHSPHLVVRDVRQRSRGLKRELARLQQELRAADAAGKRTAAIDILARMLKLQSAFFERWRVPSSHTATALSPPTVRRTPRHPGPRAVVSETCIRPPGRQTKPGASCTGRTGARAGGFPGRCCHLQVTSPRPGGLRRSAPGQQQCITFPRAPSWFSCSACPPVHRRAVRPTRVCPMAWMQACPMAWMRPSMPAARSPTSLPMQAPRSSPTPRWRSPAPCRRSRLATVTPAR